MTIGWRSARERRCAALILVLSLTAALGVVSAGCHSNSAPETSSEADRKSFKADPSKMPKEMMQPPVQPVTLPSGVPENVRAQVQAQAARAMQAAQAAQAAHAGH